jgi:hypothetical protein
MSFKSPSLSPLVREPTHRRQFMGIRRESMWKYGGNERFGLDFPGGRYRIQFAARSSFKREVTVDGSSSESDASSTRPEPRRPCRSPVGPTAHPARPPRPSRYGVLQDRLSRPVEEPDQPETSGQHKHAEQEHDRALVGGRALILRSAPRPSLRIQPRQ